MLFFMAVLLLKPNLVLSCKVFICKGQISHICIKTNLSMHLLYSLF